MPWQCRLVDEDERLRLAIAGNGRLPPGTMYFADPSIVDPSNPFGAFHLTSIVSAQYARDWLGKRMPLFVALPAGADCCVDFAYSYARGKSREGWTVTGEPPRITVAPSIDSVDCYHGFLIDGVLSDDVSGRRY